MAGALVVRAARRSSAYASTREMTRTDAGGCAGSLLNGSRRSVRAGWDATGMMTGSRSPIATLMKSASPVTTDGYENRPVKCRESYLTVFRQFTSQCNSNSKCQACEAQKAAESDSSARRWPCYSLRTMDLWQKSNWPFGRVTGAWECQEVLGSGLAEPLSLRKVAMWRNSPRCAVAARSGSWRVALRLTSARDRWRNLASSHRSARGHGSVWHHEPLRSTDRASRWRIDGMAVRSKWDAANIRAVTPCAGQPILPLESVVGGMVAFFHPLLELVR
jgi:hypothetical protein